MSVSTGKTSGERTERLDIFYLFNTREGTAGNIVKDKGFGFNPS